ncbi:phosphoribosyl-AMP cyclohydrolase [Gimibacter soli]|uniref:Phosphoribosyl-AMP cyclohydrolase n=1 Tax=Gimibacter soli TaxID=3024400 RepID=A0AAF0BI68_9PROT|nr:phosphoribosyl-AMP cyclohydrolase [Gimibacter soli]WCL55033.1 phosphoribosyl-AMP cyclohydrolase [Gimibacter soli]
MAIKNADRSDRAAVENGLTLALKYDERGLIPVVTTDAASGTVLMQAWMNEEAVERTIATGEAHYWSRSRGELWHKGATSGQIQRVIDFRTDCDQDSLWLVVEQAGGGCCHVGYESCFYRALPVGEAVDGPVVLTQKLTK